METETLVKQETALQTTPDQLLALAVNKDLDIEKLRELMIMQKEWKADIARTSFFNALADFQAVVPELRKTKTVAFKDVKYNYAPLADIVRQIKSSVKEAGLSYRWEIKDDGENIVVTCLITHREGHTERTTMSAKADTSGSKNSIQARGSSIEYLKRYTLIGALGISTADSDNDGQMPEIDIDLLHKQYMLHYNELIAIDPSYSKWHPDNWKSKPTTKVYALAINEIRKKLAELTPREA
jgi:hypothetical protein